MSWAMAITPSARNSPWVGFVPQHHDRRFKGVPKLVAIYSASRKGMIRNWLFRLPLYGTRVPYVKGVGDVTSVTTSTNGSEVGVNHLAPRCCTLTLR